MRWACAESAAAPRRVELLLRDLLLPPEDPPALEVPRRPGTGGLGRLDVGPGDCHLRAGVLDGPLGRLRLRLEVPRVDREQGLPFFDRLVVVDGDRRHVAGDPRQDGIDVPFDLRVVGLRMMPVEGDRARAVEDARAENDRRDEPRHGAAPGTPGRGGRGLGLPRRRRPFLGFFHQGLSFAISSRIFQRVRELDARLFAIGQSRHPRVASLGDARCAVSTSTLETRR